MKGDKKKRDAMTSNSRGLLTVAIIGVVIMAGVASADLITPTGVTASSEFNATLTAAKTIDGSGLTGDGSAGSTVDAVQDNEWWASAGAPQSITFDLGAVYAEVTKMRVWNSQSFAGDYAILTADIYTSSNGVDFTFEEALSFTDPAILGVGLSEDFAVNYSGISHIKFDIMSGYQLYLSRDRRTV